jgi:hypothetical protein
MICNLRGRKATEVILGYSNLVIVVSLDRNSLYQVEENTNVKVRLCKPKGHSVSLL